MHSLIAIALIPLAATARPPAGGAGVYKRTLPAVVWIQSARPNGSATGSGSLIDAKSRLVLTNYHVVQDNPKATVFFPAFRDGRAVAEKSYYQARAKRLGIPARVLVVSRSADLALLRLASVPADATALVLAPASPEPGETVHSLGNAGRSGALWGYVRGTVRQVYQKKWRADLGNRRVQAFEARVVETDSPTNPGDSGGPLVNDAGKLAGVTQGGALDAQSVSFFIDVSEVRKLLETREALAARRGEEPEAKAEPITAGDAAGVLSKEGVEAVNRRLAELADAGRPTRVETLKTAPESLRPKLQDATPAERRRLFEEYAYGRLRDTGTNGAIVLICLEPATAVVVLTKDAQRGHKPGAAKTAAAAMLTKLKAKDFGGGVLAALTVLGEKGDD